MKNKILSLVVCLMLFLSSMTMLVACKDKSNVITQEKAERELSLAFEAIKTADAVIMEGADSVFFSTENSYYEEMILSGDQKWAEKVDGYWYESTKLTKLVGGQPSIVFVERLSLDLIKEPRVIIAEKAKEYTYYKFSKASKNDGKLKIVYTRVQEGVKFKYTYIINDKKLETIQLSHEDVSSTIDFKYGQVAINEIPLKPNGVEWEVYVPSIEVEGFKAQYYVGEVLNFQNLTLNYYEDEETEIPQEIEVTPDMIEGFSTAETGSFQLTVKFLNLTLEVDYEVVI